MPSSYNHNVSSTSSVFFPSVVETLGLWTDSSVSLLCFPSVSHCCSYYSLQWDFPFTTTYISGYGLTMPRCCCTIFPSCQWWRLTLLIIPCFHLHLPLIAIHGEESNSPGLTNNDVLYYVVGNESLVDALGPRSPSPLLDSCPDSATGSYTCDLWG